MNKWLAPHGIEHALCHDENHINAAICSIEQMLYMGSMLLLLLKAGWVLHGQCFLACTSGHQNWAAVCPHPCIQVTKADRIAASSGHEGGHCNLLLARHLQVTVPETFPPQPLSQRPFPRWWYGLAQCWLYSPAKAASSCAQSVLCLLTNNPPARPSACIKYI